jgi:hypothetical protein
LASRLLLRSLSKWPSASQSGLPKRSGLRFEWQSVLRSRSELMSLSLRRSALPSLWPWK